MYAINSYTVSSGEDTYTISFSGAAPGYLDQEHVVYEIAGVAQDNSTRIFLTDTSVQISPVPADGTLIAFRRETSPSTALVDWLGGAPVTEEELDKNTTQLLYLCQEALDSSAIGTEDIDDLTVYVQEQVILIQGLLTEINEIADSVEYAVTYSAASATEAGISAVAAALSASEAAASSALIQPASDQAVASAAEALVSAGNAASSEALASTAADEAAADVLSIGTSLADAAGYATSADTSALDAAGSAIEASTSADEALASKNSAAISAVASANSAAEAASAVSVVASEVEAARDGEVSLLVKEQAQDAAIVVAASTGGIGEFKDTSIAISSDGSALANDDGTDNNNIGLGIGALKGKAVSPFLTGHYNTGIGYQPGYNLTTGQYNFLGGYQAGYSLTIGTDNVFTGRSSGHDVNSGSANILNGYSAGRFLTSGSNNVFIGKTAGMYRALTNLNLIDFDNTICIGQRSYATASGEMSLGNSAYITTAFTAASFATRSDRRDKEQIEDTPLGLDFINKLRPVSYHWKQENRNQKTNQGFIAQEVQETLKEYDGDHAMHVVRGDAPDAEQNLIYTEFIAPAIKAIQELSSQVAELKEEIQVLKGLV